MNENLTEPSVSEIIKASCNDLVALNIKRSSKRCAIIIMFYQSISHESHRICEHGFMPILSAHWHAYDSTDHGSISDRIYIVHTYPIQTKLDHGPTWLSFVDKNKRNDSIKSIRIQSVKLWIFILTLFSDPLLRMWNI